MTDIVQNCCFICFFVGTSNWEGSYFTTTAGASIILNDTLTHGAFSDDKHNESFRNDKFITVRDQLESVFLRDWNSEYASIVT